MNWLSRASRCSVGLLMVPEESRSCALAPATTVFTSASTLSTRWSSRPRWVCCSNSQPTPLITTADSTTVLTTTRTWMDRRQKVRARCRAAGSEGLAMDERRLLGRPRLVADAADRDHDLGVLGVVLD